MWTLTILGDETPRDGFIRTTLSFDAHSSPSSSQQWLVRLTDEDNSTAFAPIVWSIPKASSGIAGVVQDESTGTAIANAKILISVSHVPEQQYIATTDSAGTFRLNLRAGEYSIYTTFPTNSHYKATDVQNIRINRDHFASMVVSAEPFDTFIKGKIMFENNTPVENVPVVLQNTENYSIYHGKTNEHGEYEIGVPTGTYSLTANEYVAAYLGHFYWPEGFYALPDSRAIFAQDGETFEQNIKLLPYPAFIEGYCELDDKPVKDVLVQGIVIHPSSKQQQIFQAFSRSDGTYSLGVLDENIISVVAQKPGAYLDRGMKNINMSNTSLVSDVNFSFTKQAGLMGFSGQVTNENQEPLQGVYVVAYNEWENSPEGHLIIQTDADGNYNFDVDVEGDWVIGIDKQEYHANPHLYYKYLSNGMHYNQLDFVLSDQKNLALDSDEQLHLAEFQLLPRLPDPIFKETVINFVLPTSSYTEVEVLDMNGKELATLIEDQMSKGYQKVKWDGKDEKGNFIANGVYLCRVTSQEKTSIQPITLLK